MNRLIFGSVISTLTFLILYEEYYPSLLHKLIVYPAIAFISSAYLQTIMVSIKEAWKKS